MLDSEMVLLRFSNNKVTLQLKLNNMVPKKKSPNLVILIMVAMFFTQSAQSQNLSNEQYVNVFRQVDSMMVSFLDYSTLRKPGEDNVSDATIAKYKGLFESNSIKVDDDLVLSYFDANYVDHHQYKERTLNEYCSKVQTVFREGLSIDLLSAKPFYGELETMQSVRLLVDKRVKAKSANGLWVEVRDTVEILLVFNESYQKPKIRSVKIRTAGKNEIPGYRHMNDEDRDFIPNDIDPCKKQAGFEDQINNPGCPTLNEKGMSQEPNMNVDVGLIGGMLNSNLSQLPNPFSAYDLAENHAATNKAIQPTSNLKAIGIGAGFSYYFGTSAHIGVGLGVQYLAYSGTIEAPEFAVSYKEFDAKGNSYRRIISSASEISENIKFNQFSFPIMLKWKGNFGYSRFKYEIAAGIIYGLGINGNSEFDDNAFNYEGISTVEIIEGDTIYEYSVNDSGSQILYTEDAINSYNEGHAAASLDTASENGNDFGLAKSPESSLSSGDFKYKSGVNLAFAPTLYFKTSNSLSVSLGVLVTWGTWENDNNSTPYYITKKVGEYHSMTGSIVESENVFYAVTLGVRWSLAKM